MLSAVKQIFRGRVPVLLQMSLVECGAACLAMILGYHGRKTSVVECRDACGIGRDGVTARVLSHAASRFGLEARAFTTDLDNCRQAPLPAIAHWGFDHFVVVERWLPHGVEVVDPALGRRTLTDEEFAADFTGVLLTFEPSADFRRARRTGVSAWREYLGRLFRLPGIAGVLVQVLAASGVLQLLGLAGPLVTRLLVDEVLPLHITNLLTILGAGLLVVVLAQIVTTYLRSVLLLYLQGRLDAQTMLGFFEHLLSLPYQFFQQRGSGDLLMRLGSNTVLRNILTTQTLSIVLDGGLVAVYLGILLYWDPVIGLLAFLLGAAQAVLLLATAGRQLRLSQEYLAAEACSQSYLVEALTAIATLKASGGEVRAMDRWSNLFFKELNISLRRGHLEAAVGTAMTGLQFLSPLVLLWVGAYRVLDGDLSLGTMLALNALAISFLAPLASLISSAEQLQMAGAYLDRIADVLHTPPEQDFAQAPAAPRLSGRIDLRDVSFRYSPESPWALRNIEVTIEPGQKVAIVGRSGSGKSTLAMLLLGLHPPTEGQILYDGIPLERMNYRSLRSQFGVVLQDSLLFSGSIRQNIALNAPGMKLDQVMDAALLAGIHDEIMSMPMAYETVVAEGGAGLSGGQCQRLTIARALASRPSLLLLDEATSHLDAISEEQIDQNLNELACTRIVIAHRLSTVRNADLILVVDDGQIIERGTNKDLISQDGAYAALVKTQLAAA
jgi:ABC-type bacteriocin/lantibiotic exporter with double-glycine peptidase domain